MEEEEERSVVPLDTMKQSPPLLMFVPLTRAYTLHLYKERAEDCPYRSDPVVLRDVIFEPLNIESAFSRFFIWSGARVVTNPKEDSLNVVFVLIGKISKKICYVTLQYRNESIIYPPISFERPDLEIVSSYPLGTELEVKEETCMMQVER